MYKLVQRVKVLTNKNDKKVLKVPQPEYKPIFPIGFWIMGAIIIILQFIIAYLLVGALDPIYHLDSVLR